MPARKLTRSLAMPLSRILVPLPEYRASAVSYTYATWNPADKSASITLSGGDLIATADGTSWKTVRGTSGKTSGKWIYECVATSTAQHIVGIADSTANLGGFVGSNSGGFGYYASTGGLANGGSVGAYGSAWNPGDVITCCVDLDAMQGFFKVNGVAQPVFNITGLTGAIYQAGSPYAVGSYLTMNSGQSTIQYPEIGYEAWTDE